MKVTPNGGALQLAIQASGQGASLQSLGAGGLVQSVALSGNRNLVQNLAALGDAQGPAGRRSGTELRMGAIARTAPQRLLKVDPV